jgi:hypothetical protein
MQRKTENKETMINGTKGEWAKARKEGGCKQQAASNRQQATGNKLQATSCKQQAGKPQARLTPLMFRMTLIND